MKKKVNEMKSIKNMYRQGDELILEAEHPKKLPPQVEPENGRIIIARGEATGHHHSFDAKQKVLLFRVDETALTSYLAIEGVPAALAHQEHAPIEHAPGKYEVRQQRQWTTERVRRVAD